MKMWNAFKGWLMEALEFNGLLVLAEHGDEEAGKMLVAMLANGGANG
jgi:hypothetical protein